jgi:two-component sensor histidine kinase
VKTEKGQAAGETRDIRERLLGLLLRVMAAGGTLAYIPSVWLSVRQGYYAILVADSAAYAYILVLALAPRLSFRLKVVSILAMSYALGLILILMTGPFGAGHYFIFAFVFLAALFGDIRAMALANAAAILTHVGFAVATALHLLSWPQGLGSVIVISVNFLFISLVLSYAANFLISSYSAAAMEEKRLRESQAMLLREIEHRVKNNLQVISSLVNLRSRATVDPEQALRNIKEGLSAISAVHKLLYRRDGYYLVELKALLGALVARFADLHKDIDFGFEWRGGEAEMDSERAVSLGLLVNEVVMNSVKHAFEPGIRGRVTIDVEFDSSSRLMLLRLRDDGRGMPESGCGGSGVRIVQSLARQIGSTIETLRGEGFGYSLSLRIEEPSNALA